MPSDTVVRARIDAQVKEKAAKVRSPVSACRFPTRFRLLLVRVAAEEGLPFEIEVPNAETRAAMAELEKGDGKAFDSVAELIADLNAKD